MRYDKVSFCVAPFWHLFLVLFPAIELVCASRGTWSQVCFLLLKLHLFSGHFPAPQLADMRPFNLGKSRVMSLEGHPFHSLSQFLLKTNSMKLQATKPLLSQPPDAAAHLIQVSKPHLFLPVWYTSLFLQHIHPYSPA